MEQAEDQRRHLGIGLKAEPALISTDVIECLVDNGETDDGIDEVAIDADIKVHPQQHGRRVTDGEEADVDGDMLHSIEEKDHP